MDKKHRNKRPCPVQPHTKNGLLLKLMTDVFDVDHFRRNSRIYDCTYLYTISSLFIKHGQDTYTFENKNGHSTEIRQK